MNEINAANTKGEQLLLDDSEVTELKGIWEAAGSLDARQKAFFVSMAKKAGFDSLDALHEAGKVVTIIPDDDTGIPEKVVLHDYVPAGMERLMQLLDGADLESEGVNTQAP